MSFFKGSGGELDETRRNFKLVTQHGWMSSFKGSGGESEYVALLVMWLSRYVFPTHSHNVVAPNVYLIGICLTQGIKVALAPAVLASIYKDLTLLEGKIVASINADVLSFPRCLRPCELVGVDCVEQYSPHRVGLEFGMDQDIPDFFPRLNHDLELAWSSYNNPLNGLKLYLPSRLLNGDVTVKYSNWRRAAPLDLHDDHAYESSRTNMKSNGFCTSPSINKTLAIGLTGSRREMPMKNFSSLPANVVPTQDPLGDVINATGNIRLVNLVMTSKGDKEDSKKEHLLEGKMPLLNPETAKLCSVITKETEGRAAEEMNMMQTNNSFDVEEDEEEEKDSKTSEALNSKLKAGIRDTIEEQADGMTAEDEDGMNQVSSPVDIVIIDEEEEEDSDLDPFGALECELEARINRLQGLVSTLRAAKLCPP
ncbi:hypothetical protein Cgig2_029650 [Carnegiea gigantea]|uniref:Aminotransferase-like plant mobile domain-containing protein n=1 Tax=Carnegiea gigantea TaxID=171969 RepID=A0A9Q1QKU9_9CARY|nr:hypothetical protein Cgig2_029650 [Carnegiea gigantea]